jgi:uncharacterized membrane protein YczE
VPSTDVRLSRWRASPARLTRLLLGLALFGIGEALVVTAGLGMSPWTVLAEGLSLQTGLTIGSCTVLFSLLILLAWIPLRQQPGLGTLANALLVGVFMDLTLTVLPDVTAYAGRAALVPTGIALVGLGSGLYLTSRLGAGPRDGLMAGLHRRTGRSLRLVRACIELSAVAFGFLLGGTVGLGTVAFALFVGPAVQLFVHALGGRDTSTL